MIMAILSIPDQINTFLAVHNLNCGVLVEEAHNDVGSEYAICMEGTPLSDILARTCRLDGQANEFRLAFDAFIKGLGYYAEVYSPELAFLYPNGPELLF